MISRRTLIGGLGVQQKADLREQVAWALEQRVDGVVQRQARGVEQRPAGIVFVRQAEVPHHRAVEDAVLTLMGAIAEFIDQDPEQRRLRRPEFSDHTQC